jgi:hypothetical protein
MVGPIESAALFTLFTLNGGSIFQFGICTPTIYVAEVFFWTHTHTRLLEFDVDNDIIEEREEREKMFASQKLLCFDLLVNDDNNVFFCRNKKNIRKMYGFRKTVK